MRRLHKITTLLMFTSIWLFTACDSDDENPKPRIDDPVITARAGNDQVVTEQASVTLSAANSTVTPQQSLTYQWKFIQRPALSSATLATPSSSNTVFIADKSGIYKAELLVRAGTHSDKDTVVINVLASTVPGTIPVVLNSNISTDKILENKVDDPALADYIVTTDIRVTGKLTIQPGVRIEFEENKGLDITGSIVAAGTETHPVIFTGKLKQKGYWKGILIHSNNIENTLNHVVVEYGGKTSFTELPLVKANVALYGNDVSASSLNVTNTLITNSGGYGLYVAGISTLGTFSNNTFNINLGNAVYAPARQLHKFDNSSAFSGNKFDGVETGGTLNEANARTWSALQFGGAYLVTQDLTIKSGLEISPGVQFQFSKDVLLRVTENGYLNASGTADQRITFTAASTLANNYWAGILVETNNALNKLRYCDVFYGGVKEMPGFVSTKANVAVASFASLSVTNTAIWHGLGWGVVTDEGAQINSDVKTQNNFTDLLLGNVKLFAAETTTLQGAWVDAWSFNKGLATIDENFYDVTTGTWFNGAEDPWKMSPASAIGLNVHEDGSYVWTIAENSPITECISYSAEYFRGTLDATNTEITFTESYWRDKYYNSCDEEGNIDQEVPPGTMSLRYEISLETNQAGTKYWALKLFNPDDSFFTYYRAY
jgi:hypothetical protein